MNSKPFGLIFILFFLSFLIVHISSASYAENVPFFPIQSVRRNMEGIGKSVFYGTRIENFDVEVLDVVIGKDINQSYIVIKVTDEKIKKLGGISAGMSGSPIFFNNCPVFP